eukprot:6487601-Amphidinium_carterae.1
MTRGCLIAGLVLILGSAVALSLTVLAWMLCNTPEVRPFTLWVCLAYIIIYAFANRQNRNQTKFWNFLLFGVLVLAVLQPPTMSACQRFRPRIVNGVRWCFPRKQRHFDVIYNPMAPNHCLFDCVRFALSGQAGAPRFKVRHLRRLVVTLWRGSEQVLGKSLEQWAALEGQSPEQYLRLMSSTGWGGLPELQLLGDAFSVLFTVLDLRDGATYLVGDADSPQVSCVFGYTGCHYMVVKPSTLSFPTSWAKSRTVPKRGGSPSAQRYAIFKKLQALSDEPFTNAKQLLACLQSAESRCLNQVQGEPTQVRDALSELITKHNLTLEGGLWKVASQGPAQTAEVPRDPLFESDPWAKSLWDSKVKLLSQFFLPDGTALSQTDVGLLQGDAACGVVLCNKHELQSTLPVVETS